jgi:hypothetical protein
MAARAVPTCLLTARAGQVNRFAATPGTLTLNLKDVSGHTDFDTVNSTVKDITNPATPIAVTHTCTTSTFSFQITASKTYFVSLVFVQIASPFNSTAQLNEQPCVQQIDTIDVTNLVPGYVIFA